MTSPPPPDSGAPPTSTEDTGARDDARARRRRRRMRVIYDVPTRSRVRKAVIGVPLPTGALEDELLPKRLALPVFASDALSSVAYATEAALLVLVVASASAAKYVVPVSIAVAALLAIVVASYRQTVHAYPQGGGAYVVASDQLGEIRRPDRRGVAVGRLRADGRRVGRRGHARRHLGGDLARPRYCCRCHWSRWCCWSW